ncbi:YaaC family protein [Halalkalibacter urbisdiaboli]|uniref:YaaC family protein n=1 Tax=Halalkalibacter urbisdiaboli TaxID=1960589 RepID=UPI000B433853|nr:YaaC family protein [Halalkalibacter urbisdiaboli]
MNQAFLKPLIPFYSASYTRSYLTNCYEAYNIKQPNAKGYQNCYSFIYHLHHGQLYFEQATTAPIELRPMLLFYGTVQFMKACILTRDPSYPESSQVLAHGVTTRKRKKTSYRFLEDEVKIQKNGLYSHFLDKMFHMKHFDGEKYRMDSLLKQIPEMHEMFSLLQHETISVKGKQEASSFLFSSQLLDSYHMTPNRFEQFLNQYITNSIPTQLALAVKEQKSDLVISFKNKPSTFFSPPFLFDVNKNAFLLKKRDDYRLIPELTVHYLLLYNLSMICRYETEWWGELIHTIDGTDLPFILRFLEVAQEKIPYYLFYFLRPKT